MIIKETAHYRLVLTDVTDVDSDRFGYKIVNKEYNTIEFMGSGLGSMYTSLCELEGMLVQGGRALDKHQSKENNVTPIIVGGGK